MSPGATSYIPGQGLYKEGARTSPQTYNRRRLVLELERQSAVTGVADPITVLRSELDGEAVEVVLVAAIDERGLVADVAEVGRGDLHRVMVELPDILAVPILARCRLLVIAHNHPLGMLSPSEHDVDLTKAVIVGANNAGLIVADHLIFVPNGSYFSFRQADMLDVPEPTIIEVQA